MSVREEREREEMGLGEQVDAVRMMMEEEKDDDTNLEDKKEELISEEGGDKMDMMDIDPEPKSPAKSNPKTQNMGAETPLTPAAQPPLASQAKNKPRFDATLFVKYSKPRHMSAPVYTTSHTGVGRKDKVSEHAASLEAINVNRRRSY